MPKTRITKELELKTRNDFTKVDTVVSMSVDGRELPTMAVLGEALEDAIQLIQERVTESYKIVPPRT